MKPVRCIAAILAAAWLSGCGASRIDAGQLDYDNGIAYKHGSTEPFTGTVHFDEPPTVAEEVVQTLHDPAPLYANILRVPMDNCDAAFRKGVIEGHVVCFQRNGGKALSFDIHRGRLDGEAMEYHPDGSKAFDFHWSDGAQQGDQAVYSPDGRYVVHAWTVDNGRKRGKEVRRYSNGDTLAEGTWSNEGRFNGTLFVPDDAAVYTFKDGVKDGDFKQFDTQDPTLKRVAVEGRYRNGQKDGVWTFHGREVMGHVEDQFASTPHSPGLIDLMAVPQGDSATVTWKDGVLSGPVKILDKDQHVLLAFSMANGAITAPIVRTDPAFGRSFTLSGDAVMHVINAADVRGSSMADSGSSCLGPMLRQKGPGGLMYVFNYYCNVGYSRTHLSDLRSATINHLLDPVKFPDAPSDAALSKAEADAQAASSLAHANPAQTPAPVTGLDSCVDDWLRSSYKGGDVIATQDQIDAWKQACDQGKYPSNQGG